MALWFLIPAYNEQENIPRTLASIRRQTVHFAVAAVVIVNDGSSDRTSEVASSFASELPVRVLEHPANRGPGAAFQTAFNHTLPEAASDDILITLEADGTSDTSILPEMLMGLENGADVVLASCYAPQGELRHCPVSRRLLSRGANWLVRHALGLGQYRTCSSFFRAYRAGPLQQLAIDRQPELLIAGPGFTCMAELLFILHQAHFRVVEVPLIADWSQRRGASSMRIGRTIRNYLGFLAPLFLNRLLAPVGPARSPRRP